jgi:hypothetical protein
MYQKDQPDNIKEHCGELTVSKKTSNALMGDKNCSTLSFYACQAIKNICTVVNNKLTCHVGRSDSKTTTQFPHLPGFQLHQRCKKKIFTGAKITEI